MTVALLLEKDLKHLPRHEAEIILSYLLSPCDGEPLTFSEVRLKMREVVDSSLAERAVTIASERAKGIPLQHLTGWQTFLSHHYEVGPEALIPRPETEGLVQEVGRLLSERFGRDENLTGLEIGLGSGVISIELLAGFPRLEMLATEISKSAIQLAKKNADRILGEEGAARLTIEKTEGEVFSRSNKDLNFIVSNPPYLLRDDELGADLQHEPQEALFPPGSDPNVFYREISKLGGKVILERGFLAVEIPHQRAEAIREIFLADGWIVDLKKDLSGRERVLIAVR